MKKEGPFFEIGTVDNQIDVEITYQIIGLFSEGLYSSANKALEELVSNSFDADAKNVSLLASSDLKAADASIAVIDNGHGMDAAGLRTHWIVGDSAKRASRVTPQGRRTIGKFGIGKLAAYVLGDRLTHITKADGSYFATSMDFSLIPKTVSIDEGVIGTRSPVQLDLRLLSEEEARLAMAAWTDSDGRVDEHIQLFGDDAAPSWTAAIISSLKDMATEIQLGRLRWILSTAMPLRDDFTLSLNRQDVESSKFNREEIGRWILGRDIQTLPRPAPTEVEVEVSGSKSESDYRRWTVIDKVLGPVTGYIQVFDEPVVSGKSNVIGRSNGFFVYVNERLINPDDAGFGIDRNSLRHGTFSRFRFVVNIDRLDDELRSSREGVRQGPLLVAARNLLQGGFNFARSKLEAKREEESSERQASQRLADSPASLADRPILRLALDAFESGEQPRLLTLGDRSEFPDAESLRLYLEQRINESGALVVGIEYADLGTHHPIALLNVVTGVLSINLEHPFVAHFSDEFGDSRKNLPLHLLAVSEVVLEAQLYSSGAAKEETATVLDERDELLRFLARSTGRRNSLTVAQDLLNAANDKDGLEAALVAAFDQLGFEAVPKGGNDNPDGIAEAFLPGNVASSQGYRVSLEAKSKEQPGKKVKKKSVEVSTIARHRDDHQCAYAIVVGQDFESGKDEDAAVLKEIARERESNPLKGITLMRIADLARLVRLAPVQRLSLAALRPLFDASSANQAAEWVDEIASLERSPAPYRDILETVWEEQRQDSKYSLTYSALRTALRHSRNLRISDEDLRADCLALARMAPNLFFARDEQAELLIKPDRVMETIHDYVEQVPQEDDA